MYDLRTHLKVKIKSLVAEKQIIMFELQKLRRYKKSPRNKHIRSSMIDHRRTVIKSELRHTFLAYGFLRKRTYAQLEPNCKSKNAPDWDRVWRMILKHGPVRDPAEMTVEQFREFQKRLKEQFDAWLCGETLKVGDAPTEEIIELVKSVPIPPVVKPAGFADRLLGIFGL